MGYVDRLQKALLGTLSGGFPQTKRRVSKKGAAYTCVDGDSGTVFVATGIVTFTLPAVAFTGWHAWFSAITDNEILILSAENDNIIGFNDVDLDSVAYTTAGDQIGGSFYAVSTGAEWLMMPMNYADGVLTQTITLAD